MCGTIKRQTFVEVSMAEVVVRKSNKLGWKVWLSVAIFGLMGQIAWIVENIYFSTYIQKNITMEPWASSATVAASAVVAALVSIFGGVLTDRVGKRKVFVCFGYIVWGLVTAAFALFGNNHVSAESVVTVVVVFVIMDCVMTVFGSLSNDAAFSAWVTDVTDITNRGFVDVVLSIMPVAALMIIFVGFDGLTQNGNWTTFFLLLGGMTALSGVVGLFLMKDSPVLRPDRSGKYFAEVAYGFRPKSFVKHKMIYVCLFGMMFSGLSMQLWQPYMIVLLQYTLGFGDGYVLLLALVVLLSAVIAVIGGKLMDKFGKEKFFYPVAAAGVLGGLIVYLIKFCGGDKALTFALFVVGGTLIEGASLLVAGLFNASARDYTPKDKAGCFQGVRIIIYVTVPMILASLFTPLIINGFGEELKSYNDLITSNSGYNIGDKVYPFELFLFSAVAAAFVFVPSVIVRKQAGGFRRKELLQINADVKSDVSNVTESTDCVGEEKSVILDEDNK